MSRRRHDKIFNNTYEEQDYEKGTQNFKIESGFDCSLNPEDDIHENILFNDIHELIENSVFKEFNILDENGEAVSLNKIQINEVYNYITGKIGKNYRKIEIWSTLSQYFNIYPNKFYSSLSNKFKHDLVIELDNATNFLEKNKIRKVF